MTYVLEFINQEHFTVIPKMNYNFQKYLYNLLMKSSGPGVFLFWTIFNNKFNFSNRYGTLWALYHFAVFFKKSVYFI